MTTSKITSSHWTCFCVWGGPLESCLLLAIGPMVMGVELARFAEDNQLRPDLKLEPVFRCGKILVTHAVLACIQNCCTDVLMASAAIYEH